MVGGNEVIESKLSCTFSLLMARLQRWWRWIYEGLIGHLVILIPHGVDEVVFSLTHSHESLWIIPALSPRNKFFASLNSVAWTQEKRKAASTFAMEGLLTCCKLYLLPIECLPSPICLKAIPYLWRHMWIEEDNGQYISCVLCLLISITFADKSTPPSSYCLFHCIIPDTAVCC